MDFCDDCEEVFLKSELFSGICPECRRKLWEAEAKRLGIEVEVPEYVS